MLRDRWSVGDHFEHDPDINNCSAIRIPSVKWAWGREADIYVGLPNKSKWFAQTEWKMSENQNKYKKAEIAFLSQLCPWEMET